MYLIWGGTLSGEVPTLLKPKLSTNFDATSLDTSNLSSNLISSQTKWVYLQK